MRPGQSAIASRDKALQTYPNINGRRLRILVCMHGLALHQKRSQHALFHFPKRLPLSLVLLLHGILRSQRVRAVCVDRGEERREEDSEWKHNDRRKRPCDQNLHNALEGDQSGIKEMPTV